MKPTNYRYVYITVYQTFGQENSNIIFTNHVIQRPNKLVYDNLDI